MGRDIQKAPGRLLDEPHVCRRLQPIKSPAAQPAVEPVGALNYCEASWRGAKTYFLFFALLSEKYILTFRYVSCKIKQRVLEPLEESSLLYPEKNSSSSKDTHWWQLKKVQSH